MKKKIFITGGAGLLGSNLAILLNEKYDVLTSKHNQSPNIKKIVSEKVNLVSSSEIHNFFLKNKPDIVINTAGLTNVNLCEEIPSQAKVQNVNIAKNIANASIEHGAKLIHISSTSVYGKQAKIVDENCEKKYLKPQSPYAKIKLIEENMLKKEGKNLKYVTFRLGTIAGVSRGIRFHTAVNKFCFNAALSQKIEVYKTALHQYRPYLSVRDAFKVFKFCIDKNFFKNDIFNAVSGNFTVNQILSKIKKRKKFIKVKFVNSRIMNQLSYHVDDKKIRSYGLKLNANLQKDIDNTLKLFSYLK